MVYNTTKTFIIDHPSNKDKYLVHGCVEGPNTELIYRGKGIITDNTSVRITIPEYASLIGYNWSVHLLTSIGKKFNELSCSEVDSNDGSFIVYGNNGEFYWVVYGQRTTFNPEPNRSDIEVKGDGPYKWYVPK